MKVDQSLPLDDVRHTYEDRHISFTKLETHYIRCRFDSYLDYSDLSLIRFTDCDFTGTCLDPNNVPNGEWPGEPGIGYRTNRTFFVNCKHDYVVGKEYEAPVLSTSSRDCHPGLYVEPSLEKLKTSYWAMGIIKVKFDPKDVHGVNGKYRVKKFRVLSKVKIVVAHEPENPILFSRSGITVKK